MTTDVASSRSDTRYAPPSAYEIWHPYLPAVFEAEPSTEPSTEPPEGLPPSEPDGVADFWCDDTSRGRRPTERSWMRRTATALRRRLLPAVPHQAFNLRAAQETTNAGGKRARYTADESLRAEKKRIVICADGTWNSPSKRRRSGEPGPTNVWLLYKLVRPSARDGRPQLAYYHRGVGTSGLVDQVVGGAFGRGISRNVLDCYRVLIDYYQPGDELSFFGFSRGAYTVRSLAGLVRNAGIIDRTRCRDEGELEGRVREAWALYRSTAATTSPTACEAVDFRARWSHPDARIACLGVWDTVGALGIPNDSLLAKLRNPRDAFHDVRLSRVVDHAFHALAIDERRGPFEATLFEQLHAHGDQVLEQRWFPGAHADVGGGYPRSERGLATVALRWMAERVTHYGLLDLDAGLLAHAEAACPGRPAVHDSLSVWYYTPFVTGPRPRVIDGGLGRTGARDPDRALTETVDHAAVYCGTYYPWAGPPAADGEGPRAADVPGGRYDPENVAEYASRLRAAQDRDAQRGTQAEAAPAATDGRWSDGRCHHAAPTHEPARTLAVGESTTAWVRPNRRWNPTGLRVAPGERYRLVARGVWYDANDASCADGYEPAWARPAQRPALRLAGRLRRVPEARWLALVAATGRARATFQAMPARALPAGVADCRGLNMYADAGRAETAREMTYAAAADGDLELFANDVPMTYGNNTGGLAVTVTRLT